MSLDSLRREILVRERIERTFCMLESGEKLGQGLCMDWESSGLGFWKGNAGSAPSSSSSETA